MIHLNLNDTVVRVKLTEYGHQIHKNNWTNFRLSLPPGHPCRREYAL